MKSFIWRAAPEHRNDIAARNSRECVPIDIDQELGRCVHGGDHSPEIADTGASRPRVAVPGRVAVAPERVITRRLLSPRSNGRCGFDTRRWTQIKKRRFDAREKVLTELSVPR